MRIPSGLDALALGYGMSRAAVTAFVVAASCSGASNAPPDAASRFELLVTASDAVVGDRELRIDGVEFVLIGEAGVFGATLSFASYEEAVAQGPFQIVLSSDGGAPPIEYDLQPTWCHDLNCQGDVCQWGGRLRHERIDLYIGVAEISVACVTCTGDVRTIGNCF
jgi:hypothetical protein